ncbi:hypothetical protein A3Q56_06509 [Intoshia linei]|uniref:Uncharacterized protein n=1 Tax=Intoshia linei TaxID=1819745 RepID=A0A177AVC1_9BILA|nr:hypothetical protein A3Q56_06509 [Intoshia linei]
MTLIDDNEKYNCDPKEWIQRFENVLVLKLPEDAKISEKKNALY